MSDTALTVLGMSFIFVMTTAGSSIVYFSKSNFRKSEHLVFGVCFGHHDCRVRMVAADSCNRAGFRKKRQDRAFAGCYRLYRRRPVLVALDYAVPHMHTRGEEEGPRVSVKKSVKLFLAVTIHNIPEGLAVGFAFGAAAAMADHSAYISALGLAIGVGVQNFPEGAAVSLPLKTETGSKNKAFLYGMGSGAVEPVFAVIGFFLTSALTSMQPWLMAFAAGAMIFVVAEDLIPDAKLETNPHLGTWGVMAGFVVMMILDVSLG